MTDKPIKFELDEISKRSLYSALREMDKNSKTVLKDDVTSITKWMATAIQGAAQNAPRSRQASVVARSVRARKDVMPHIVVGGTQTRAVSGTPAGVILYGNEFGSDAYKQFPNWSGPNPTTPKGSKGWWIFPALRRNQDKLTREWKHSIEKHIINPWGRNGGY